MRPLVIRSYGADILQGERMMDSIEGNLERLSI